jgi:hypothetical protein
MFPDAEILRRRASACARLPWVLPATVLLGITDADLDALASAPDEKYWTVLNRIVSRITSDEGRTRGEGRGEGWGSAICYMILKD